MSDKQATSPIPRLDLAPNLRHPFQAWNPFGFLRLLYWVFFFPQALPWYRKTFVHPEHREAKGFLATVRAARADPALRPLFIHEVAIAIGVSAAAGTFLILDPEGGNLWSAVGLPLIWLILLAWRYDRFASIAAGGVLFLSAFALLALRVNGSSSADTPSVVVDLTEVVTLGMLYGTAGLAFGTYWSVADSEDGGVQLRGRALTVQVLSGLALGLIMYWLLHQMNQEAAIVVIVDAAPSAGFMAASFVLASLLAWLRPLDWVLAATLYLLSRGRHVGSRVVWLPLPGLQRRLERELEQDWAAGLQSINQMLSYSAHSRAAIRALNAALERMPEDQVLPLVVALSDSPHQKDLLFYCSTPLLNHELQNVLLDVLSIPNLVRPLRRRVQARFPIVPRLDTPTRAACAGFLLWHQRHARGAASAFSRVKALPGGWELHSIALTLDWALSIGAQARMLEDDERAAELAGLFGKWLDATAPLEQIPTDAALLGPHTIATLMRLRKIAGDAYQASNALTPTVRATAAGRAVAELTRMIDDIWETCPDPEAALAAQIAAEWRDVLIELSGQIGELFLRQPVENPYEGYSGLPVLKTFVGRDGVLNRLNQLWTTPPDVPLPPIILHGHRRMGKTSILRRLESHRGPSLMVAPTDMQDLLLADHTGQLLFEFARAVHLAASQGGLDAGQDPVLEDYGTTGTARIALNELLDRLNPQMSGRRLLLLVDEYELAEDKLAEGTFEPGFVRYLRAAVQRYRWLGLIFAGLQSLEDELHHYRAEFYGMAEPIKVTFLGEPDALRLIRQPTEDFALEYEDELAREVYRLTHGQPYLLQRLCWELVEMWNQRFMEEREETLRVLTLDDLHTLLTPGFWHRFFEQAGYYFSGVWEESGPDERRLMAILARIDNGAVLDLEELLQCAGLQDAEGNDAVESALRHDFVLEVDGGYQLAVPLMRRWLLEVGLPEAGTL